MKIPVPPSSMKDAKILKKIYHYIHMTHYTLPVVEGTIIPQLPKVINL